MNKRPKCLLILLFGFALINNIHSQATLIGGTINIYTPVTAFNPCTNSITVVSSAGFLVGDTVVIIQMQGATIDQNNTSAFGTIQNYNNAGNYEFAYISAIAGNVITFQYALLRSYTISGKVQLIKVRSYSNATATSNLTCPAWNGSTGGVLVLEVINTLTLSPAGGVNLNGVGFSGGATSVNDPIQAQLSFIYPAGIFAGNKGEGISILPAGNEAGKGAPANAGGGGNAHNGGGGGGANYGIGGTGGSQGFPGPLAGTEGIGGYNLSYSNAVNKIFLGGGGGGAHTNNFTGTSGGVGGGIVIIKANTIVCVGGATITAIGNAAVNASNDGGGGGGSGGTVLLDVQNFISNLTVITDGGKGGNTTTVDGPGGGGGGGLLWISGAALPVNVLHSTAAGAPGTSPYNLTAVAGQPGGLLSGLQIPQSNIQNIYSASIGPVVDILCNGDNNGSATVVVNGGTPPYVYAWSPSGGTSSIATNLAAGNYTCTITDANNCITTASCTITQPTPIASTTSSVDASCGNSDGSATVNPSGGTPGYTYLWTPGGQTAPTAINLASGAYTCTVTDANGCTQNFLVSVNNTNAPAVSLVSQNDVTCYGGSDGNATVTVNGGVSPYTYFWSPSGGTNAASANVAAGNYACTVTDAVGCSQTLLVTIDQPTAITSVNSQNNISCNIGNDGSATVNVSGGTPTYTYAWSPASGTNATANNLSAGNYTCTITDVNGCIITQTFNITAPSGLTASATQTNVPCTGGNNGSATASPTGGTPGYTYSWSPAGGTNATAVGFTAGIYSCTITDAAGCVTITTVSITEPPALTLASSALNTSCNGACDGQIAVVPNGGTSPYTFLWNTGCTTASCSAICAGSYTVTVTDNNGCTNTSVAVVNEPAAITTAMSSTTAHCGNPDGSASVVAGGGTSPYTYSWSSGGSGTTENNLLPGNYTVTVTDSQGCTTTATVTVLNDPGTIITLNAFSNVSCFTACDGSASVNVSGGSAPYTIAWSPTGGNAASAANLCAGTYTCSVTDNFGCVNTFTVSITEPALLTVTATNPGPSICNGQNAQLGAVATGGTGPYTYTWQPGNLNGATQTVSPIATTTFTVFVTDFNGCTAADSEIVIVHALPVIGFAADTTVGCSSLCVNFSDLSTIPAPYSISSWSWNFGDGGTSFQQNPSHCYAAPGTYTVSLTVTSSEGCIAAISINNYINILPWPTAAFTTTPDPVSITDPAVNFTDQSTAATSWIWNFGENSSSTLQNPSFAHSDTGCYIVQLVASNAIGCADTAIENICIQSDWAIYIPNCFTPNGDGVNDVFMPDGYGIDEQQFEMWIFDRWGNMIYYTEDLHKGWNGKANNGKEIAQIDTYVYKVRCKDVMGNRHTFIGKVSLVK